MQMVLLIHNQIMTHMEVLMTRLRVCRGAAFTP